MFKKLIIALIAIVPIFIYHHVKTNAQLIYEWPENKTLTYEIDYSSHGKSFGGNPNSIVALANNYTIGIEYSGKVSFSNLGKKDGKNQVLVKIVPSYFTYEYTIESQKHSVPAKDITFLATWSYEDGFGDFYTTKSPVKEYEHLVRSLLDAVQIHGNRKQSWYSTQELLSGKEILHYVYNLNFFDLKTLGTLKKIFSQSSAPKVVNGSINYIINSDKYIDSISGSKTESYIFSGTVASNSVTTVDMNLINVAYYSDHTPIDSFYDRSRSSKGNLDGTYTNRRLQARSDFYTLDGRTLNDIKTTISAPEMEIKHIARTSETLAAFLRLNPNRSKEVADLLKQYKKSDYQFGLISTALGQADTPQAQSVMREYIAENSETNVDESSQVLLNIAFTKTPTLETEQFYRDLYQSTTVPHIKRASLYALGITADNLKNDEKKEQIVNELAELFYVTSDRRERTHIIRAISNTQHASAFDVIKTELKSPKGQRIEALNALAKIQTSEGTEILLSYAEKGDDVERLTSIRSLAKYRISDELLDLYEELLFEESRRALTTQALKNMKNHKSNKNIRELAEVYKKQCPTNDLCKLVNQVLE